MLSAELYNYTAAISSMLAIAASCFTLYTLARGSRIEGRPRFFLLVASALFIEVCIIMMLFSFYSRYDSPPYNNAVIDEIPLSPFGITAAAFVFLLVSWIALLWDRRGLEKLAYTDKLTGLPNRNGLNRFLDTCTGKESVSMLFFDLDQFKMINDTWGHHIGDLLVQEAGNRLHSFVSANQRVFRIGGDEFLIVSLQCGQDQAASLAEDILQQVNQPFLLDHKEVNITASIGISSGTLQSSEHMLLLQSADVAMHEAKKQGKNRVYVYNDGLCSEL
ncbi:GGDEF domain-containing protein [Paenibacillus thalictri]|uniref:GGDEF domain-containing protein n=1 Tax=Paenibacillus thalictri TaxID=2527873 RepID=A0A4Q9DPY3_9BACL|nr:GGDEF domain-containing protein [Paenibacillus thalictri]TBL77286.1 GGDEF domain-containing protein [Paenibacillus thalictri]